MKFLIGLIFAFFAMPAGAQDMKAPRVISASIDWSGIRNSLSVPDGVQQVLASPGQPRLQAGAGARIADEQNQLGTLNKAVSRIFPNIAVSPVPVLLPLDTATFLTDLVGGGARGAQATSTYLAGFSSSKFFLPGPSGYDAAFLLGVSKVPSLASLQYRGDVELQISGSSVLYELAAPAPPSGELIADLQNKFPGIRRVLHEGMLRYTFARYGAPYVISLQCANGRATSKTMSCAEADRVASYFLDALQVAGGTPNNRPQAAAVTAVERPARNSPSFTYQSPGDLIPKSGYQHDNGSKDRTVYAAMRFPIAQVPAFANSQEFLSWGHCYGTGQDPVPKDKGDLYRCTVNDKQLRYFEGDSENFNYPWRDNFCEMRDWLVGQCPHGHGHQGQDIRPPICKPHPKNSSRCAPYQHDTVAVRDAYVLRSKGQEAAFLVVNAPNEHIRFRYLHMSPKRMDADGLITNRKVTEGEKIGKVGNYLEVENGTTYHLHFDVQVPTKDGWVWVSPYMTLVAAYERVIGGKGKEVTP